MNKGILQQELDTVDQRIARLRPVSVKSTSAPSQMKFPKCAKAKGKQVSQPWIFIWCGMARRFPKLLIRGVR